MKVNEVMTPHVECVSPDETLRDAARRMKEHDVGSLPICENDRLVGMVTDRDIAIRAVAEGMDPGTTSIRDIMTPNVNYCFEDQDLEEATQLMQEKQIRRLVVLNRDKRLAGIVSLGDLATHRESQHEAEETLEAVCQPA